MSTQTHVLTAVAFVRSTGGRMRVLLAVDRCGVQLYDGEPAILVEHRPGDPPAALEVDCADELPTATATHVRVVADELVALIEAAFDDAGAFVGERLLGRTVEVAAPTVDFDPVDPG